MWEVLSNQMGLSHKHVGTFKCQLQNCTSKRSETFIQDAEKELSIWVGSQNMW